MYKKEMFHLSKASSRRRREVETTAWNLSCDMCGQTFTDQTSLDSHLAAEHENAVCSLLQEASHVCPFCEKTFKTGAELFQHRSTSHGDTVVSGLEISNPHEAIAEESTEVGVQISASDQQLKPANSERAGDDSEDNVASEPVAVEGPISAGQQNAIQCGLCCEFFRDQYDLHQHNLNRHQHGHPEPHGVITNPDNRVTCPFCPFKVVETGLKSHVINRHTQLARTCPTCRRIRTVPSLVTHVERCRNVNTVFETDCRMPGCSEVLWGKTYDEYLSHMYSHGKPYGCTVCGLRGLTEQRLKAHLFIHQPFSLDPNIPKHPAQELEILTRARPGVYYGLPSLSKPYLEHVQSAHDDYVVLCKLCQKTVKCDFPGALKLHFRLIHGLENVDDAAARYYATNQEDADEGNETELDSAGPTSLSVCPFCPSKVVETGLKLHVEYHHGRLCRSCPRCCKILPMSALLTHIETCRIIEPAKTVPACKIPGCEEVLWRKSPEEYLSHMYSHGTPDFCTVCYASSSHGFRMTEKALKAHLLIHQPFSLNAPKQFTQEAFVAYQDEDDAMNEDGARLGLSTSVHESSGNSTNSVLTKRWEDGADSPNSSADTLVAFCRTLNQKFMCPPSQRTCSMCSGVFQSRADLLQHARQVHNDLGRYCPHCDVKLRSLMFEVHKSICPKRGGGSGGLKPLQLSAQSGALICGFCTKHLPIADAKTFKISKHMLYHMGHLPQTQVTCPICFQTCQNFHMLDRHLVDAHCDEHVDPQREESTTSNSTFGEHLSEIIDRVVAESLSIDDCTSEPPLAVQHPPSLPGQLPSSAPQYTAPARGSQKTASSVQLSSSTEHLDTESKPHTSSMLPPSVPSIFTTPRAQTSAQPSSSVQYSSNFSAMPGSPSVEFRPFQQSAQPSIGQAACFQDVKFAKIEMRAAEDLAQRLVSQFNARKQSSNISFSKIGAPDNEPAITGPTPIPPVTPPPVPSSRPWHLPVALTSQPKTTTETAAIELSSDEDSGKMMTCLYCPFTSDNAGAVRAHFTTDHPHYNYNLLDEHLVQQEQKTRREEQDNMSLAVSTVVHCNQDPIIARKTATLSATANDTYERKSGPCESFATDLSHQPDPSTVSQPRTRMSSGSLSAVSSGSDHGTNTANAPAEGDQDEIIQCLYCDFTTELSLSIRSHYFNRHYDGGRKGIEEYARLNRYLVVQDQRLEKIKKQKQELEAVKEKLEEQQRMFNERLEEQNRILQQKLDRFDEQMQIATVSSTMPEERSNSRSPTCVQEIPSNSEPLSYVKEGTISVVETPALGTECLQPFRASSTVDKAKLRCRLCSAKLDNNKSFVKHVMKEHPDHLIRQNNKPQVTLGAISEVKSLCEVELHAKKKRKCNQELSEVVDDTTATLKLLYSKWKLRQCSVRLVDCQKTSSYQPFSARREETFSEESSGKSLGQPGAHIKVESFGDDRTVEKGRFKEKNDEDIHSDHNKEDESTPTQCPLCDKILPTEVSTKDHIVRKHSRSLLGDQFMIRCPGCDFSSTVYKTTYAHILDEHEADEEALAELAKMRDSREYVEIVKMAYEVRKRRRIRVK